MEAEVNGGWSERRAESGSELLDGLFRSAVGVLLASRSMGTWYGEGCSNSELEASVVSKVRLSMR